MKKIKLIGFSILIMFMTSCDKNEEILTGYFVFTTQYSTTIVVGGVVGITERTFEIGEVYYGTDKAGENITIRIAEHTELNKDCPNSWCYQEFLDVPRVFLKIKQ